MQQLRKVFFNLFTAAYVCLCPLIILYAFGYVFDLHSLRFLQTGLVVISTVPEGTEVFVGSARHPQKTPTSLRGIAPGTYILRLSKKGFRDWRRTIHVKAGKPIVFDSVPLLPAQPPRQTLGPERIESLIPLEETPFFLFQKGETACGLYAYDSLRETLRPVLPGIDGRVKRIYTVRGSFAVMVAVSTVNGHRLYWVPLTENAPSADMSGVVDRDATGLTWDVETGNILFLSKGAVRQCRIADNRLPVEPLMEAVSFSVSGSQLYAVDRLGNIVQKALDRDRLEPVTMRQLAYALADERMPLIKPFPSNRFFVLTDDGSLYSGYPPGSLSVKGIRDIIDFPRAKGFLVWGRNRIGWLDASLEEMKVLWFFKNGTSIRQCQRLEKSPALLFSDRDKVFIIDSSTAVRPEPAEICAIQPSSRFFYSERSGWLYFLEPNGSRLCRIRIGH